MTNFNTYISIIAGLAVITGTVFTILERIKIIGKKMLFVILSILGVVLILGVFITTLATISNPPPTNGKGTSSSSTVTPSSSPTQMIPSPTTTPSPLSTSTETPLAQDGKHALSIRLTCTPPCSDPILVTITNINIQSQLNNMQWTITLQNTSPYDVSVNINHFYLLEGDQTGITNPIPPSQGLDAEGQVLNDAIDLSHSGPSTANATTMLTFAFVPYATNYTLESEVHYCGLASGCHTITFGPKLILFNFH